MNLRRGATLSRTLVSARVIARSAASVFAVQGPRTISDEIEVAMNERDENGVRVAGAWRWRGRAR